MHRAFPDFLNFTFQPFSMLHALNSILSAHWYLSLTSAQNWENSGLPTYSPISSREGQRLLSNRSIIGALRQGLPSSSNMFFLYASTPGWLKGLTPSTWPLMPQDSSKK